MEHPVKDYYYSSGGFGGQHNPSQSLLFSLYTSVFVLKECKCATTEQQQQKLEDDDNKIQSSFPRPPTQEDDDQNCTKDFYKCVKSKKVEWHKEARLEWQLGTEGTLSKGYDTTSAS